MTSSSIELKSDDTNFQPLPLLIPVHTMRRIAMEDLIRFFADRDLLVEHDPIDNRLIVWTKPNSSSTHQTAKSSTT